MTEKLYYQNQYLKQFTAKIEDITEFKGKTAIILDKTAFFPEGGGQTSDIGFIDKVSIVDVQIDEGIIYHLTESTDLKLTVGAFAECSINWNKRFSDMQNHSGEHIFSGVIHNHFGLENLGFHLGKDAVTLDFGRILSKEELDFVEYEVNKIIWSDRFINCYFPDKEELKNIEYRSKKEISDELRLVEIDGVDVCACCAPHVNHTGEIGIAKIIGTEKVRGGTRISILCGERAFNDIRVKTEQNKAISVLLSEKESESFSAVQRIKKEKEKLAYELNCTQFELIKCKAESFENKDIQVEFCDLNGDNPVKFAELLSHRANKFSFVFNGTEGRYNFVIIGIGQFDVNQVIREMKSTGFKIKGGGRNNMVRGIIESDKKTIFEFFSR